MILNSLFIISLEIEIGNEIIKCSELIKIDKIMKFFNGLEFMRRIKDLVFYRVLKERLSNSKTVNGFHLEVEWSEKKVVNKCDYFLRDCYDRLRTDIALDYGENGPVFRPNAFHRLESREWTCAGAPNWTFGANTPLIAGLLAGHQYILWSELQFRARLSAHYS